MRNLIRLSILVCFGLMDNIVHTQSYEEFTLKEQFDAYNANRLAINYLPCTRAADDDQGQFGDGMAYILEAYVTMYQTTRDKGYLYKFIKESICMMENRNDYAGLEAIPRWSPLMYHNGNIVAGLARFVHFVKLEEPALFSEELFPFPEVSGANEFALNFSTFGEYANWLQDRCGETIWWFISNGYWSNDFGFANEDTFGDAFTDFRASDVNQQAGFARALLFIGLTSSEPSFLDRANRIAELYHEYVVFYDNCEEEFYFEPFLFQSPDNSYWWYQKTWGYQYGFCGVGFVPHPSISATTEFVEDISHAILVTSVPMDFYQFQPSTPFTTDDLIRFRNMFTKHAYNPTTSDFNVCVDGISTATYSTSVDIGVNLAPLGYMRLSEFDGADATATSPNVYEITMNYYLDVMYNVGDIGDYFTSSGDVYDYVGAQNRGHSEMVAEQWERECPNLTLFSRHVVYDQGFYAKGNLTIDPTAPPALGPGVDPGPLFEPYAEPKDVLSEFVVDPNVQSSITAVKSVHLKAGVHFAAGSRVHVYIDDEICVDGFGGFKTSSNSGHVAKALDNNNTEDEAGVEVVAQEQLLEEVESPSLQIYPNPNNGSFTISGNFPSETIFEMTIRDASGKLIYSGQVLANSSFDHSFPAGIYFVSASTEKVNFQEKLIVSGKQ